MKGDALRLHQVLLNLASNAIKFTAQGSVRLSVRKLRRSSRKARFEFVVTDTGIGISADKLSAIFEGFSQAEASTTRRFGGTGLGLAISQRLVQLMGGMITVKSAVGEGSSFAFEIDMPIAPADAIAPALTDAIHGTRGLHVLIADDSEETCEVLSRMAVELGWHADVVSNGTEAIAKLSDVGGQTLPYDLLLIDWQMPHMDGWETARRIRAMANIPQSAMFVLVSSFDLADFRARRRDEDNPFDGFVSKPVTLSILLRLALGVVRKRVQARRGSESEGGMAMGLRLAGVRVLVAEDFVLNQELLRALLEQEGARVTIASDGAQALACVAESTEPFDIVMMDVQMPTMDGLEATRQLRRQYARETLPILAITANAQASDRDRCLAAGMDDYVAKPIAIETVVAKIRQLTEARFARAIPLRSDSAAHMPGNMAGASGDIELALIDSSVCREAFRLLSGPGRTIPITAHFTAIERLLETIRTAAKAGDTDSIAKACHKLMSAAASFGAIALAHAAGDLSRAADHTEAEAMVGDVLDLGERSLSAIRELNGARIPAA